MELAFATHRKRKHSGVFLCRPQGDPPPAVALVQGDTRTQLLSSVGSGSLVASSGGLCGVVPVW